MLSTAKLPALAVMVAGVLVWAPGGNFVLARVQAQAAKPATAQTPEPPSAKPQEKPAVSPEAAKQAQQLFEAGQQAERDGHWRLAYAQYAEAAKLDIGKPNYAIARELAKSRIAQDHVDHAEAAAVNGLLDQAILELRAAVALEPSYGVAAERLRQLQSIASREIRIREIAGGDEKQVRFQPGTRSFNFRGNTRGAFEEIARQFGVTATFDDAIRIRTFQFKVPDVDARTALDTLARQTSTFWIPVGERSFFVADDTEPRRRDFEPIAARTITLPTSATTERMTELVRILRDIFDIRRVQLDVRTRTLILRDAPGTIALATALVEELEQPRGELMLEVTVAEVDRAKALRLGLLPPSQVRVYSISPEDVRKLEGPQQSIGDLTALLQRIFGTAGGNSLGGLVPPLIAFGGGQTVGLATLPGASLEFQQAMSVFRAARRVMLRSEDGQPASFFIGERYPINMSVLGSLTGPGSAISTTGTGIVPRQDFPAGDGPSSILTFDLNLDGRLDLAVTNQAANTVSVLLGNGDGSMGAATNFSVGLSPASVAVGDFNGDAILDIVTANEGDDTITVLFGSGDGTFGTPNAFAVGILPRAVVVGNFNNDNHPDVVVANHGAGTVSMVLGDGAGGFSSPSTFLVGAGPIALRTADFNSDGRLDVAAANQNSNNVSILLGAGDGTFPTGFNVTVGTAPRGLFAANLNADTHPDLAVANEGSNTVSVLLGNGDGTFTGAEFFTGLAPRDVFVADFDGGGTVDIITANFGSDTVTLLVGNGDGTLGLRADLGAGNGPIALAGANLNSDGRLDLAIANQLSDDVTIILNTTTLGPTGNFATPNQPYPGFQFEELGLKVRATPRMHRPDEVTLQLNIEIRSRSGDSLNGIPVITNRTLEETVRLKEDETTVIGGILQRDETLSLTGTPGLAQLLVPRGLVTKRDKESGETELLLLVTPRRLRLAARTDRTLFAPPNSPGARQLRTP